MTDPSVSTPVSENRPFAWGRLVLVVLIVMVLAFAGIYFGYGRSQQQIVESAKGNMSSSSTVDTAPLPVVDSATLPGAQSAVAPDQPAVAPAFPEGFTSNEELNQTLVYTYSPGGPNYAFPEEGSVVVMDQGWQRIVKAANGQFLPWTFNVRVFTNHPLNEVAQWRNATRLYVVNPYTETLKIKLELRRDLAASAECNCNPYEQAFGAAQLGGGWFVEGVSGSVTVGGDTQIFKTGLENFQMNFPSDFKGVWTLDLTLEPGAQLIFTQGERVTDNDTWDLPSVTP